MAIVISTLAQDNVYAIYENLPGGSAREIGHVLINGGQGVMNRRKLITPYDGVVTEVSSEELAMLEKNPEFRAHRDRGYIRVVSGDEISDRSRERIVAHEMEQDDDSAQLTGEDFAEEAAKAESLGDELKIANKKVSPGKRRSRKRNK